MSFSFLTCFEAVSEETRLWKPETAPHATVTKRIGNMDPVAAVKPVKAGRFIVGLETKIPITAAAIMATRR